ncbi:MAG: hypothetical protein ACRC24_08370 [Vibrionaceae bacterium]
MQPAPITGTNGVAQAQGAAGGGPPPPPQQGPLNITGVRNAAGVNPSLLGDWEMETSPQQQNVASISLRLQRRMPPLQVTPENTDAINFTARAYQPDLRPLPVGAEALTAEFTVTPKREEHPQTYQLNGFAKDDRLAIGPMSAADRERLETESTAATYRYVLNAITALTDTDTTITTTPSEHKLEAEYGGKKVVFRRPVTTEAPQQETGALGGPPAAGQAAESPHDREIKERLLRTIQNGDYHFNPDDHTGNCTKLKQQWTLCYYQGTTPVPPDNKTTLKISNLVPEVAASPLYADFRQPRSYGEDGGVLALNRERVTFTNENVYGDINGPLNPLPGDTHSLPQMFTNGVTLLHLNQETFVVISEGGEVLGFAKLNEPPELPEQE